MKTSPQYAPNWLTRSASTTLTLPLYDSDGRTLVAPSSGTFTLLYPDGTKLVDAQAVTVSGSVAQYTVTVPATYIPDGETVSKTVPLGDGYLEKWAITISGQTETYVRDAAIVRSKLYPVVVEGDITDLHNGLDDVLQSSSLPDFGAYIRSAWKVIVNALRRDARHPQLVLSPYDLRLVHLYKVLELIFTDAGTNPKQASYLDLADRYGKLFEQEWKALSFVYDADQTGTVSSLGDEQGVSSSGMIVSSRTKRGWRR